MLQSSTTGFLTLLKKNNNKPWFDQNREKYISAKNNFEEFTQAFEVRFVRIIFFLFLRISANAKNYRNKSYSTKLFSFMSWQITISEYFNFCI